MDIKELKQQAYFYLQQEDFTIAINLYQQCLELTPDDIYLYWYLGLAWLLLDDEEQCHVTWLSSFENIDIENENSILIEFTNFLKNQAQKYVEIQKFEIAQKIYQAVLEWDENPAEVYYQLGYTIANQGDLDTALECWQTVIEIQPDFLEAHLQQGYVWQKLGNYQAAVENYQNAISLRENHLYYYRLGLCYSHLQEWKLAQNCFLQTIKIKDDYADAYSDLGFVFLQQGNFTAAVDYLRQATILKPEFSQSLVNLSAANLEKLKPSILQGIQLIQTFHNSHIENTQIYLILQQILVNDYPEIALQLLKNVVETEPQNLSASLELSKFLLNHNQCREATAILHNFVDVENEEVNFLLGKCWLSLEDYQKAILHFRKCLEIDASFQESYYFLGVALFKLGNFQEAIQVFKQQVELGFDSGLSLAYLGFVLGVSQRFEESVFYFQKALEFGDYIIPTVDKFLSSLSSFLENQTTETQQKEGWKYFVQIKFAFPPSEFYESVQQWLESENLFDNYIEVYPEIDVKLTYPQSLDEGVHFSFRFGNVVQLPASFVVKIPQGRFWLSSDQTQSAIITDESHFLADISPHFPILSPNHPDKHPRQHPILSKTKLSAVNFIDGKVGVLAGLTNNIYFHWMLDVLPRWELLRLGNFDFADIDYFVVENKLPFQRETLAKLGIPENKQINISQFPHLQARELIVPSFPGCVAWMPKWTCDFLRTKFLKTSSENISNINNKRIYITRKLAKSRRILNEEAILKILESYGFETVILESMSVEEQAVLFSQAEVIISPHGSGLTNLVFCQPGIKVIELFSPNYVYHCYWWISNLVGLDYYYLLGETLPGWNLHHLIYPQEFNEDIFINLGDFEKILKIAQV
jgi:tetratricopeptide (TPR) repeat protein